MQFDSNISLGTIISALSICLTIVMSVWASYLGITRHMTKTEQQISAMLDRLEKLEKRQDKSEETVNKIETSLSGLVAQMKFFYEWVMNKVAHEG